VNAPADTGRGALEHTVGDAEEGATLASLVRRWSTGRDGEPLAWSKARDLCRTGRVLLDGQPALDDATRVRSGQSVVLTPTAPRRTEGVLPREDLLHVDADVAVVRKPAGVVTVPYDDGERDTLVDRVRALLARLDKARRGGAGRDTMAGVVQRLDKDTTGVLVFARNMPAKRALEEQFRVHSVERRYLALAHGDVRSDTAETMLVQDRGDGLRGSWGAFRGHVGPPPRDAKRAVTHLRALERLRGATLVECRLETGRQHQIRIHLSERGHALVGEPVYIRDHQGPRLPSPRPMLHAAVLGFEHPRGGATLRFEDPPPADFAERLEALRVRPPAPSRGAR